MILRRHRNVTRLALLAAITLLLDGCVVPTPGPLHIEPMNQAMIDATNAHLRIGTCGRLVEVCDIPAQLVSGNAPSYPRDELANGVTGTVILDFSIGADGRPSQFTVQSATSKGLAKAAVDAVGTWTFRPALHHGKPVVVRVRQPVMFQL